MGQLPATQSEVRDFEYRKTYEILPPLFCINTITLISQLLGQ